jgi:hypothetical protein
MIIDPCSLPTRKATVDRSRAHLVLVTHLPVRDWRWLGLRLRCHHCGQRYPCPPRRIALSHLDRDESTMDGPRATRSERRLPNDEL